MAFAARSGKLDVLLELPDQLAELFQQAGILIQLLEKRRVGRLRLRRGRILGGASGGHERYHGNQSRASRDTTVLFLASLRVSHLLCPPLREFKNRLLSSFFAIKTPSTVLLK